MYTLFVAIDANFKLKLKNRGINDPELAPGWASFVEESSYQNHIRNYIEQPEVRLVCFCLVFNIQRSNSANPPGKYMPVRA
jgi:hypothetical protein